MRATTTAALLTLLALAACDRPDDQPTGSISAGDVREAAEQFTPEVRAALDSGNASYRRDDFRNALRHYQRAVAADEDATAAWFGVYMAQRELGDSAAAARALERVRDLAPGATMLHDEADE